MRKLKSLNFNWHFTEDFKNDFLLDNFDYKAFKEVNLPHTMKELPFEYFNEIESQFIGTYFHELVITEADLNEELSLDFHGVMTIAEVYINGKMIMTHEGGYTPFSIIINSYVKPGSNLLIVKVDGNEIKDIPPFGNLVDYLPYSGIYREVYLSQKPIINIKSVKLFTEDINVAKPEDVLLYLQIETNTLVEDPKFKIEIFDQNKLIQTEDNPEFFDEKNGYVIEVRNIERWTVENPKLYLIKISMIINNEVVDVVQEKFGFRTVLFTNNGFLINNQRIKLMGLNRHQSYPYVGYAAPKSMQEMDADILKSLGVNIVRTSHYMQSDHFLNRCDEIGLLVFEEIPGWNYIGNEHFKELSLKNLEVMINHHFNHPSICLWGVRINESKDDDEFYQRTNDLAKSLDPSRQTGGVRNFKKSNLLEDVYTYNDFSHVGDNPGLEPPKKVSGKLCPYMVTEYNGHVFPTKKTDSQSRRVEHSLRHLNVIEYNHYYDTVSGAIGWCMADYNTHFQFGSNDHICHHGVLDMHRLEKYAAYAYKSQKDPEEEPVLFVASNMIAGDYDLLTLPQIIVYTNCDYVKLFKNDEYVDTYYPDDSIYEYMPHPPVIIEDLIGNLIKENEEYSEKDAEKIKSVLLSYQKNGFGMPLKEKLRVASLMIRKVLTMDDAMILFGKYLANQGQDPINFRFEGYLDDELVKVVEKGHMLKAKIEIKPDKDVLTHGPTYDMTRIVVEMQDQFGNILDYGKETFVVETDDALEVVGPKHQALVGGSTGIYIRTKAPKKQAKIKFTFNNFTSQELIIKIENGIKDF
jgi:beta-galactosidase